MMKLPTWWTEKYGNQAYHIGDCLEGMKTLPDKCIDLVLTDPPYGTNDKYGKITKRDGNYKSFDIDWDDKLPLQYIAELYRIMKDDTWGVIFTDKKEITTVWNYLENVSFAPRNTYYLIKNNPPPSLRSNFMSGVEVAVVFTKGTTKNKWNGGGATKNYEFVNIGNPAKIGHPTAKSIYTYINLIKLMSNTGDVVLDPFLGSGTLLRACVKTNRVGLGFELNPDYKRIIVKRISDIDYIGDGFESPDIRGLDGLW